LADFGQGCDALGADLTVDFVHEVGGQGVQDLLESFVGQQLRVGGGEFGLSLCVESCEKRDLIEDQVEVEDAGGQAVFEVSGEVGDFVREIDELGFERGLFFEEVFVQGGIFLDGVVAGVFDDAFADGEGEVEAREGWVALFEAADDAQGVEIVVEAEVVGTEGAVESLFAGMAEGGMADVVDQGEGFGEGGVEAERGGGSAG
jgi:hypothetical protein